MFMPRARNADTNLQWLNLCSRENLPLHFHPPQTYNFHRRKYITSYTGASKTDYSLSISTCWSTLFDLESTSLSGSAVALANEKRDCTTRTIKSLQENNFFNSFTSHHINHVKLCISMPLLQLMLRHNDAAYFDLIDVQKFIDLCFTIQHIPIIH